MKHLGELNSSRFFCSVCSIGEQGSCQGTHIKREIAVPGSTIRTMLIIAGLGIVCVIVFLVGLWNAAKV